MRQLSLPLFRPDNADNNKNDTKGVRIMPIRSELYLSHEMLDSTGQATLSTKYPPVHIIRDICYTVYLAVMFATPLDIRSDTSLLYNDPSVTGTEACPFNEFTPSGKLSTPAKLLQHSWAKCSKNLCTQWQMANYVSALLLA
jgi:hypothetical protein